MAHSIHPPVIGAALPIAALAQYADWLKAQQRDLEIQDPFNPTILDIDWQPLVAQAHSILDGYTGRMGIHGPFMGLTLMPRDPKVRQVVNDRLRQALEFVHALGATHSDLRRNLWAPATLSACLLRRTSGRYCAIPSFSAWAPSYSSSSLPWRWRCSWI